MLGISDSQKKVLSVWALIGVIVLLLVILIATVIPREKKTTDDSNFTLKDSRELIDRNRYYTIKNAITKFYSYLNMNDTTSVLEILDESYKKDNNLTTENVLNHEKSKDIALSYQSKVMCYKGSNEGIYTFVVEGEEIGANTGVLVGLKYYEVVLDGNTSHFSLKPIDETIYKGVCDGTN